jgi:hypothetical protein
MRIFIYLVGVFGKSDDGWLLTAHFAEQTTTNLLSSTVFLFFFLNLWVRTVRLLAAGFPV